MSVLHSRLSSLGLSQAGCVMGLPAGQKYLLNTYGPLPSPLNKKERRFFVSKGLSIEEMERFVGMLPKMDEFSGLYTKMHKFLERALDNISNERSLNNDLEHK